MPRFGLATPPYSADDQRRFPTTQKTMETYAASANPDAAVADLCAQTVCFLWFESLPTLNEAATIGFTNTRVPSPDSFPKADFVKWTKNVLHTTQVSTNVVILAMLYIFRLKLANPGVKGKAGSEFRLLTVALMLGNKYLDDNTYTNKTWSEVTQINVKEIHLMEVEFLSNMRYSLLVTVEAWQEWLLKINAFVQYQHRQQQQQQQSGPLLSVPQQGPGVGLPSPPMLYEFHPLHPSLHLPSSSMYLSNSLQTTTTRKRSFEEDPSIMLPPAKVISLPTTPRRTFAMTTRSRMQPLPSDRTGASQASHHRRQQSLAQDQQSQAHEQGHPLGSGPIRSNGGSLAAARHGAFSHQSSHSGGSSSSHQGGVFPKQLSLPPLHLSAYGNPYSTAKQRSPMQHSRAHSYVTSSGGLPAHNGNSTGNGNGMTGSPTGSSASRFSLDSSAFSHLPLAQNTNAGAGGHASGTATPTTVAMQHRHSPYGPVYGVQRLVWPLPQVGATQMGRMTVAQQQQQQQVWWQAGRVPPQQLVYQTLGVGEQSVAAVRHGVLPQVAGKQAPWPQQQQQGGQGQYMAPVLPSQQHLRQ